MTFFKRFPALILALSLMLSAALAEEEGRSETAQMLDSLLYSEMASSGDYTGAVVLSGQLYAYTYSGGLGLYDDAAKTWQPLTAKGEVPAEVMILRGEDKLYALDKETGAFYACDITEKEYALTPVVQLKWASMRVQEEEYAYTADIATAYVTDGALCLLAADENYNYVLRSFDLKTGEVASIPMPEVERVQEFMPYQGKLALLTYSSLYLYSPKDNAVEKLGDFTNGNGMAEDTKGHLYLCAGDEIWSNRDGAFSVVGYGENGMNSYGPRGAAVYQDRYYVMVQNGTVSLRDVSPESKPAFVLRIAGNTADLTEAFKAFAKEYPNVPVVRDNTAFFSDAQTLTEHMRGSTPADIYGFDPSYIKLSTLARKEFAAPLDLSDYAAAIADKYREALSYRGQLYAVGMSAYAQSFGVSVKAFKKVGLSEDDIPKTYAEMMDFIDRWQEEFAQEYPEMQLLDGMQYTDMKMMLLNGILHTHELNCQKRGEDAQFSGSELQLLLEKLAKTDFYGFYDPNGSTSFGGSVSFSMDDDVPSALFTTYASAMPEQWDTRYTLMPLAVSEEDGALIGVSMTVAVMNPDTAHIKETTALLKCIAENTDLNTRIALMPDENSPVENTYMVEFIKEQEARVEQVKKLMDEADEEKKAEMQDYLDEMLTSLADMEKYRYSVTKENIDAYRAREDYLVPDLGTIMNANNEITALNNRFRDSSITAREYLGELNRKVQMMLLEGD